MIALMDVQHPSRDREIFPHRSGSRLVRAKSGDDGPGDLWTSHLVGSLARDRSRYPASLRCVSPLLFFKSRSNLKEGRCRGALLPDPLSLARARAITIFLPPLLRRVLLSFF